MSEGRTAEMERLLDKAREVALHERKAQEAKTVRLNMIIAVESRRMTASDRSSPTTFSTATSRLTDRTRNGWPTSPTSGPQKAGSTSRPSLICIHGVSSVGL